MECEKDLSASAAYHGIHLDNRAVGPSGEKSLEILVRTAQPAGLIDLEGVMGRFPGFVGNLSGQVDIFGGKDTGIHIIVDRLFREHDLRRIGDADVVDGLPFFEEGRNECIQLEGFVFIQADAGSGFGTDKFVFLLGGRSGIKMFFERAFVFVGTRIADVRRFCKSGTGLFKIVRTVKMTFGAKGAFFKMAGRIGAESGNRAMEAIGTVIERMSKAAGLFKDKMTADFLGNSGAVPA